MPTKLAAVLTNADILRDHRTSVREVHDRFATIEIDHTILSAHSIRPLSRKASCKIQPRVVRIRISRLDVGAVRTIEPNRTVAFRVYS
jgi:hypothetical protein